MNRQQHVIDFLGELSVLLQSGMTLDAALELLSIVPSHSDMREALEPIHAGVRAGDTLSSAMRRYPDWFDSMTCGLVAAGEVSGDLPAALDRLVPQLERGLALRSSLIDALIYPLVLGVVMIISLVLVITLILPELVAVVESLNAPRSSRNGALISLANWLDKWAIWFLFTVCTLSAIAWLWRSELGLGSWLLRQPPLGSLLQKLEFARFTGAMASLLGAGVPQVDALRLSANTIRQSELRNALLGVEKKVREGQSFSESLATHTPGLGASAKLYAHSLRAGEEGGQLPQTLDRLSHRLEREFAQSARRIVAIAQPALIVIFGLLIGSVVYLIFAALQSVGSVPL